MNLDETSTNRILVVDDDALLIGEYLKCLGKDFEPDAATSTLGDLEKVLFGEDTDDKGAAKFEVQSRTQGDAAVEAVRDAVKTGRPNGNAATIRPTASARQKNAGNSSISPSNLFQ